MATTNEKSGINLYPVHCTECGEVIENKFFPLDTLLDQYYNGGQIAVAKKQIIYMLGIGANYGDPILPEVPALLQKISGGEDAEPGYKLVLPDVGSLRLAKANIREFACENNDIPEEMLTKVNLNIASILAQFYLMTGFETIFTMLRLQKNLQDTEDTGEVDEYQRSYLAKCCDEFSMLPGIRLSQMTQIEMRRQEICRMLSNILKFAEIEASHPEQRHFATETLQVGWRYKTVNNRKVPFALAVMGSSGNAYHATDCCCDKCHRELPYEVGAYRQKIIGLLGTQATGKTTYLTALTDAIDMGELTAMVQSNGTMLHSGINVSHSMANDPQWIRVTREPGGDAPGSAKAGALWLYKHGFPPEKTDVKEHEAPALTFLISGTNAAGETMEPVMYTLADIPGEAFSNAAENTMDELFIQKQHKLLYSCNALIMVISSRQMMKPQEKHDRPEHEEPIRQDSLIRDPHTILACYKSFLPQKAVPTAVVLTAADEINDGDLREALQLAYDLRSSSALVWSERKQKLVYNAELMQGSVSAVMEYMDKNFGAFMKMLTGIVNPSSAQAETALAAFAVSSGTQCAPLDYSETKDEEYRSKEKMEERCRQMRKARFGVTAPILWMMACDGILDTGRGDNAHNAYHKDVQAKIQKKIEKYLYI